MPWYICENCGQRSYSAAPLQWLRDPHCRRCRGKLIELPEEERMQIRFENDSASPAQAQKAENKADG